MHIRAQSIDLMPEIEQNCIQDLVGCAKTDVKGEVSQIMRKNNHENGFC